MMFDKREYREVFSKVTASDETYRRIMDMTNKRKRKKVGRALPRIVLVAAIISLLAVTVSATEYVQNWFAAYFSGRSDEELSQGQVEYIEENVQNINEIQTQNEWTVELHSAMNDGTQGYIIIGITAPEGVNLSYSLDENGRIADSFSPGNGSFLGGVNGGALDIVTCTEGISVFSMGFHWEEDGDGLDNTKNYVIEIQPNMGKCEIDPFGSEAQWFIHIENIVREYRDDEYLQELCNGKYKGQTDISFTSEETIRMHREEVLVEGVWDFTINFAESEEGIELLSEPVNTTVNILRKYGAGIDDYAYFMEDVTITSFVLRPLSATISYEDCNGTPAFDYENQFVYAVMEDGTRILLWSGSGGDGYSMLTAQSPIVLEEVDYILMADGTKLPMPELSE